jgi:type II secretory pathway predicted ATPase ExeA
MYERFFLLSHRPFTPAPQAEAYIPTGSLDQARQTLVRCIERGEGPGLVIGPAGTGKSLLCQILAKHFRGRFQVALLSAARLCTRRALLQSILFELKLPYRDMDEGELRLSLIDHLEPRGSGPEGLLLLVDEAQTLPLRLLEEIRVLTNLVREGQSRVRLVLAGGMALEERLASPKLESFQQRIAARCYLQPLGRDETIYYVQEQIRRAGGMADHVLTGEAQAAIHTASDGIPRLINQLCDHALLLAALGGVRQITEAGIEEAWADLQQLPVPLNEPPVLAAAENGKAASIVEFGELGEGSGTQWVPGVQGSEDRGQRTGDRGQESGVRSQDLREDRVVAGKVGPSVGEVAGVRLDEISRRIEMLRTDEPVEFSQGVTADDFSPAAGSGTEVELVFHSAHDPFGSHWDEEEVVIDRYASLEDAALRKGQRVTSDEGRKVGAAITAALATDPVANPAESSVTPASEPLDKAAPLSVAATLEFHPASDPLLPDETPLPTPARRATIALGEVGQDDRDLIVVDDDEPPPPTPLAGRPRRQEYRKLFTTLRSK